MKNVLVFFLSIMLFTSCNSDDEATVIDNQQEIATIVISPIYNIKGDIANSGGEILDDGGANITAKGICWSTSPNPDLQDNIVENGSGIQSFISALSVLDFNTTYYVRAYAVNSVGTAYSEELSFMTTNECTLNVFVGNVRLSTQSEVDSFGSIGYCKIEGQLVIESGVTDLSALNNLRSLESISIYGTHELEDLSGIDNLTEVAYEISVIRNDQLKNIDALSNVVSPITNIVIANNLEILNVDGLLGISTLVRTLENAPTIEILGNPALVDIDGLANISIVDEETLVAIGSSDVMTHLDGLSNISGTIRYLGVTGIDSLIDINGLSNITRVNSDITINNNSRLLNLDGIMNLKYIQGDLDILNNSIIDFCGLNTLIIENGLQGNYNVLRNSYNPTIQDILDGNCSL